MAAIPGETSAFSDRGRIGWVGRRANDTGHAYGEVDNRWLRADRQHFLERFLMRLPDGPTLVTICPFNAISRR